MALTKIQLSMVEGGVGGTLIPVMVGRVVLTARVSVASDIVYLSEGSRSGLFVYKTGSIPYLDQNQAIYVSSVTPGFHWARLDHETGPVNILWGGAIEGDNPATDNWAMWIQTIRFCGLMGRKIYVPSGRYRFITAGQIDMTLFYTGGLTIEGDNHGRSILDFRACTFSPNLQIFSTGVGASYFLNMHNISVIGSIPGIVMRIGQTDLSDPPNIFRFTGFNCQNFDTTGNSRGVELNFVCGSYFDWQVNCGSGGYVGGNGIAVTLNQCVFNQFFGSMGSAETAVLFNTGHSYGNVFNTPDFENVKICVRFLSGPGLFENNTFIGGQWSYSFKAIDCQEGVKTLLLNPKNTPNLPAVASDFIGGSVGLTIFPAL